jgi:hypothetical protein
VTSGNYIIVISAKPSSISPFAVIVGVKPSKPRSKEEIRLVHARPRGRGRVETRPRMHQIYMVGIEHCILGDLAQAIST